MQKKLHMPGLLEERIKHLRNENKENVPGVWRARKETILKHLQLRLENWEDGRLQRLHRYAVGLGLNAYGTQVGGRSKESTNRS